MRDDHENVLTAIRRVAKATDLIDDIIMSDLPVIYTWLETCEDEIVRHIRRGDNLVTIRRWFRRMVAKTTSNDLTEFERVFLNQIFFAYLVRLRKQAKRASTRTKP